MADVFISYSKKERLVTETLAADLQRRGFSVWWDTSLVSGDEFRKVIINELALAKAAIVIWTPGSIASDWVYSEASRARAQKKLIPLRSPEVDVGEIPPPFDVLHTEVIGNFDAVCAALEKIGVRPGAPAGASEATPRPVRSLENLRLDFADFFSQQKRLSDDERQAFHEIIAQLKLQEAPASPSPASPPAASPPPSSRSPAPPASPPPSSASPASVRPGYAPPASPPPASRPPVLPPPSPTPPASPPSAPPRREGWSWSSRPKEPPKDLENILLMETTKGRVVIALRPDLAPKHVERIKQLAREGFYDGIVFHRVIDGFMAQTGCPHGTGTGGSGHPNLEAEFNAEPHVRGVCSMARAQNPNSANSQFFICFDEATFLDKLYTVWGKVVEGMENVDKIKRGEPVQNPDKITSLKVAADVK